MTNIKCYTKTCVFNRNYLCSLTEIEISNGSCMNSLTRNQETEIIKGR